VLKQHDVYSISFIQFYYYEGDKEHEGKESSDLSNKVIGCVLKVHETYEISSSPSCSVMVK
jgi:hypothetical protein